MHEESASGEAGDNFYGPKENRRNMVPDNRKQNLEQVMINKEKRMWDRSWV